MSVTIKTADQLEAYFKKLQIEQKGHLGDITLTIGQQDELMEAMRAKESAGIKGELEHIKGLLDDAIDSIQET